MQDQGQFTLRQLSEFSNSAMYALTRKSIAFKPVFADLTGTVGAALMLSQAFYWSDGRTTEDDGWFYKTANEWQAETRLSRREQEGAREKLRSVYVIAPDGREIHIWEEALRKVPATLHFRINAFALGIALQILESGVPEFAGYLLVAPEAGRTVGQDDAVKTPKKGKLDSTKGENQFAQIGETSLPEKGNLIHRLQQETTHQNTTAPVSPAADVQTTHQLPGVDTASGVPVRADQPVAPIPGEFMTGLPKREYGKGRPEIIAEHVTEAKRLGMPDARTWVAYYNRLADACGLTALIDNAKDDRKLDDVRSNALALLGMGIRDIAALDALIGAWKADNGWRLASISPGLLATYQSKRMAEQKPAKAAGMVLVEYQGRNEAGELVTQRREMTKREYKDAIRVGYKYRLIED